MESIIKVYTDGSCRMTDQNNYGGIGFYFQNLNNISCSKSFCSKKVTNQRMELLACIHAIKRCLKIMEKNTQVWELNIYSDSKYVIDSINEWAKNWEKNNWKKIKHGKLVPIKNKDLIVKLYKLSKMHPIKYFHIKSHQIQPLDKQSNEWLNWNGNNIADQLAKKAMKKIIEKKNKN
ncbi:Ribonuclease H [uncultured virus]|nr:Ribonuclease H [uncultured virus]